ncbi:MAG: type II toxin-antitoxin system VapC family toxin [Noviherbaspirillum sp.]
MRLLLDTNVLLWTLAGSSRIEKIKNLILAADTEVHVSTASWWEIAIKAGIGKLDADVRELRTASTASGFLELPILGSHTEVFAALPLIHRDPFDRMIVSQAIAEPMRLFTSDSMLEAYSDLVQRI